MPMNKALAKLCEIIIEQNMEINSAIKRKTIKWDMVVAANKEAIHKIKKLRKKLQNEPEDKLNKPVKIETEAKPVTATPNIPVNEPSPPKKSSKEIEQENEYEKLVQRIAQIKDDKLQQQLEDENDELISRLNRFKPVQTSYEQVEEQELKFIKVKIIDQAIVSKRVKIILNYTSLLSTRKNRFYQFMHLLMSLRLSRKNNKMEEKKKMNYLRAENV